MMDSNKKNKALIFIIIFLLITNIAMLIFFVVLRNPGNKKYSNRDQNGMSTLLQKEVGFSKEQLDQYQALRTKQRQNIKPLFNEVRKAKENFYGLIYSPSVSDSLLIADADSIAQTQKKLDLQMFHHFKMVRNICTPDQLQKFDSTIKKVVARMTGRSGRGKPRQ
jgi:Spy/CpxP family protein refolding chaperone